MYMKDKQTDKKFARFEEVLTNNMQDNFILKKEIEKLKEQFDGLDVGKFGEVIDQEIEQRLAPVKKGFKEIHDVISRLG